MFLIGAITVVLSVVRSVWPSSQYSHSIFVSLPNTSILSTSLDSGSANAICSFVLDLVGPAEIASQIIVITMPALRSLLGVACLGRKRSRLLRLMPLVTKTGLDDGHGYRVLGYQRVVPSW